MIDSERSPGLTKRLITSLLTGVLLALVFFAGLITGNGMAKANIDISSSIETALNTRGLFRASPQGTATAQEPEDEDTPPNMDIFWEVWDIVDNNFYYDLPEDDMRVYGAISGMLYTLGDPYTAFVPPDVAAILNEDMSGEFEGIGAYVEEAPQGGVYIIRVFEGGPAEQAGILAGDIVVMVDGQDVTNQTLNETLLLIRGPAGTDVTLTIYREGESDFLEFVVTRATIEVPTVESEMLEGNIGYVALYEFNAEATNRLRDEIKALEDEGAESLILDLRGNPGGFLDQSIGVADLFLPKGLVVIQRDVEGNVIEHKSTNQGLAEEIPLVVLVDENSASASEIVAGAIQDRERGILIGQTTFGKGSVQVLRDLSDGSQLRLTYANWFTPNDNSINEQGVTPDIIVEMPETPDGTDPQLERAIEYLMTGQ